MTLVVARISGEHLTIVSDTSMTEFLGTVRTENYSLKKSVIKSIIINENLAISFAGDLFFAKMALEDINSKMEIEEAASILFEFHKLSLARNSIVEFIVCAGNPKPLMYEIQSGKKEKALYAYIGDRIRAHNIFKNAVGGNSQFQNSYLNISIGSGVKSELDNMGMAMDTVINNYPSHEVGGFRVQVNYTNGFHYVSYIQSYGESVKKITFTPDKMYHILEYPSASEGGYNVNFMGFSSDYSNIAIHIQQAKLGLLFTKKENIPSLNLNKDMDETDFAMLIESLGITSKYSTENRRKEYTEDSNSLMVSGRYVEAIKILDKLIFIEKGKERAYHLCNKGMCLIKMKNRAGFDFINQAVDLEPNLIGRATSFIRANFF